MTLCYIFKSTLVYITKANISKILQWWVGILSWENLSVIWTQISIEIFFHLNLVSVVLNYFNCLIHWCQQLFLIWKFFRPAFLPYLEKSFDEVLKLLTYPQDDIRKAAVEAVTQFIINFSKIETDEGRKGIL